MASAFNVNTTPKTISVTTQTGDRVVVMCLAESANATPVDTAPTGNSNTFNQIATLGTSNATPRAIAWTYTEVSGTTYNISAVRPTANALFWGVMAWVYRDSDGFGAVGAPTVSSTRNSVT